ncbi:cation diffusion facilitator family transporter [Tsuneonella mangrovi]|uniref:cation diffusion facilitator family transporter n=1 Tax=Tsuneonella mangrovi TaxID=1982042 RepID=UPI000BA2AA0E|nr:cation diffusion facilitator family transporter [Tsuneonella mangrovi]
MGHEHAHDHSHNHSHAHAPASFGRAFAIGIVLNTAFVIVEAAYGFMAGSMALVADAGHNLSDVLSLALAWIAAVLATRSPGGRFTYGFKSSTILAALANAGLLLVAIAGIAFETVDRMAQPPAVEGRIMMIVAGIGIVINAATAVLFMRGSKHDLNVRGAFLHMAADALVSLGVVIAGGLILLTGQSWIDPATSLLILGVIAWGTWGLLKDSVKMGLNAVPAHIDQDAVRGYLAALPGVSAVHDLHIWPMSTTETALTAHLEMPGGHPGDGFLHEVATALEAHHRIVHTTVQIETSRESCRAGC